MGDFDLVSDTEFADYKCLHKEADYKNHYPDPRSVTDHAIRADREENYDKLLLHYMPPHAPYITEKRSDPEMVNRRGQVKMTEEPRNNSFEAYLDNLRWGLDEVELLLDNINRDNVVITADHGQYFGKWFYGHISGQLIPSVRMVPWVETEAEDSMSYEPEIEEASTNTSVKERLHALGYK